MLTINGHPVERRSYPNGESLLDCHLSPFNGDDEFRFTYLDDADLIQLYLMAKHFHVAQSKSHLIIEYMPYSRLDRVEDPYRVFTLKYIADFINGLGFHAISVVEPHSDVTCAVLNNAKPIWVVPRLLQRVKETVKFDPSRDYVIFPDAGAEKRYRDVCTPRTLVARKHRDFGTGRITDLELLGETPTARNSRPKAIIVDDLCSRGGTFVATAQALRNRGFYEIYLVVAHVEPTVHEGELFHHIDGMHATDSMRTAGSERLTIHKLGDLL